MRFLSILFSFPLFLSFALFPGCQKREEKSFNAYLPPSFENYFADYVPKEEVELSPFWQVDDVDISYIDPNKKLIAFTFDDAPNKTMKDLLSVFQNYNQAYPDTRATATFFINGKLVNHLSMDSLYTAHLLGFELGNHTQNHLSLPNLSKEKLLAEINNTDAILQKIDGKERHLLRAPFGHVNELVKAVAEVPLIDWTIDTLDWTGISADAIYQTVWKEKFDGGIVLMHDGYPHTMSALTKLLVDLRAENYQIVSVSALAKAHRCSLKNGQVYIRARKQQDLH